MNTSLLLLWNSESIIGTVVILSFGTSFTYLGLFQFNEEDLHNLFIKLSGKEPFNNAAKLINYLIKFFSVLVGLATLLILIIFILSNM